MSHIIVNDGQARVIPESVETIEARDRQGRRLICLTPGFTEEDRAIEVQRFESDEPR